MIALLQRVTEASVRVGEEVVGAIGPGLAVFLCVERGDGPAQADRMLARLLDYRVFGDGAGRLNRSLVDTGSDLLLVPQFTLAADTRKGTRPSLGRAAPPDLARRLFEQVVADARRRHPTVAAGRFGAHMQVSLVNDGPVTFWLEAHGALN
ncbi:MAG: D-aminoacyl-tRNA deacylase [Gammaproteobacteria bacterium]